jgi:DNA-binding NtrC family response regulator
VSARKTTYKRERVLIVSDDDDLNLLLEFLLEVDGFQVAVSTTSELAVQTLLKDQPKAIFFDLNFQGGLSLLEFIQEACPHASTFTVVRPEFRTLAEQALRTGAQGFLMTPVDYRSVRTLLEGSQTVQEPVGSDSSTYRTSRSVAIGN